MQDETQDHEELFKYVYILQRDTVEWVLMWQAVKDYLERTYPDYHEAILAYVGYMESNLKERSHYFRIKDCLHMCNQNWFRVPFSESFNPPPPS
jgi:hypothetical protein